MTKPVAMNTATTRRQWRLDEAIDGYARHGAGGIVPWRDQVLDLGVATAARRIREAGMYVTGYCRGGMFPASDPISRRQAIDDNRRMIEEAAELGAPVLVLVCGGLADGSTDIGAARSMIAQGISEIMEDARQAGVRLAIEPLHPMYAADRSCINTLAQANDICDLLEPEGPSVLGVAVDVYHVWWDPNAADGIRRAGSQRLLGFHLCDWLMPTKDMLNDRGLMGDGVIDLPRFAELIDAAGFRHTAEVEIFSETMWRMDPDELTRRCIERAGPLVAGLSSHGPGAEPVSTS